MDAMMISVIIPTYNREGVLMRSIESVLNQTYEDFELLVMDDCSTDSTTEMVASLEDPRIRYHRLDKNSGQGTARNIGVGLAKGDIIAFQDSDDVWRPRKLEKQLAAMTLYDADICTCRLERHGFGPDFRPIFPTIEAGIIPYDKLLEGTIASSQTIFVKKDILLEHPLDATLTRMMDWDWMLSAGYGKRVCLVDDVLVDTYLQGDSLTNNGDEKLLRSLEYIHEKHADVCKEYPRLEAWLLSAIGGERTRLSLPAQDYFLASWKVDHSPKTFAKYVLSKMGLLGRAMNHVHAYRG